MRYRTHNAEDPAKLTFQRMQLAELKQTLANLSKSLDGTGPQMENREVMLVANVTIAGLDKLSTSHRDNHETVGAAIRLVRQAGRALIRGKRDTAARIFLKVSEELPEELPESKLTGGAGLPRLR
jgi:hypothetical protein